jgi:uncharacterized membrane protein
VPWLTPATVLVVVHVVSNTVWIGALLSVSVLAARAPFMADPTDVGSLARRVYLRLAAPAFLASLASGVGRIWLTPGAYVHLSWMHAKLLFALGVIVFHHIMGGRVRRIANGRTSSADDVGLIGVCIFVLSAAATLLGVVKSLPPFRPF